MMAPGDHRRGRILLVEDEELLRWSIKGYLEKRGYMVETVSDGLQGLKMALSEPWDLVIADLQISGVDGLSLASAARESNPHLQVIIITGHGSKATVIQALRQGVWDYVEKPFDLELLLITVEKALEKSRMEKEMIHLSRTDGLTGLFNQRHFYSVLSSEMRRAGRQKHALSLILLDVDDFKGYNDLHGHLEGDEILARLAACIMKACRKDVDSAFRYGGDEFIVVLPEAPQPAAEGVAERICHYLKEDGIGLTLSIGITELSGKKELRDVVKEADEAMYLAKQFGGNRTVTFQHSG